ncbi:hypothetical protein HUG20_02190 [Salicibibacter cibi]|uniref:Citrate transporter-like domain-containing protein n=1 Tax=Salicibibacter cibi TaxID=2743001 RepID=A0A7T7CEA3_9BACI|nr:hypothetical protein [Salicibibacter cibi]QQK78827.1 hypothetical protein HUG20_02190 [Salicibibacter cibi]
MHLLYSLLIFIYLINAFLELDSLNYVTGILAILLLVVCFRKAERLFQLMGTIFAVAGLGLFIHSGINWYELPYYLNTFVEILALFFVLPFINGIIIVGRYDQSVNKLLKSQVAHLGQLYGRGMMASYLLGSFLNIAMIPLVQSVLQKNLQTMANKIRSIFISQAMLRAYALCLVWSPMEVMVALTIDITQIDYLRLLPWLLVFSIALFLLSWAIGRRYKKYRLSEDQQMNEKIEWKVYRKIAGMLIFLVLFIGCIILMGEVFGFSFLTTVSIIIIPYSTVWAFLIKRIRTFYIYSLQYWRMRVSTMGSYVVLFLSLGLFIGVLRETELMTMVQEPLLYLSDTPLFLFVGIQLLFLGLAFVGFHPLVTMGILGEVIQPLLSIINPMSFAIVLITSSLSTVMAGPFNITVTLTGSLLKENPYRIAWWNIAFAFIFSGTGTLIALFLL